MARDRKRLGLIVNPVAGMGGPVGLKGSDGEETLRRARELGATPISPGRAVEALKNLVHLKDELELVTCSGDMGEAEARQCGFEPLVICRVEESRTTPEDTRRAALQMAELKVDLLLFAGGDGTARDIYDAIGDSVPVVGIPAGVKIHSGVYAINPAKAGQLAGLYLCGQVKSLTAMEVMDIDEEAFRHGRVAARLYGYLSVPLEHRFTQGIKAASLKGEHEELAMRSIADHIVETMEPDWVYIIGSGTTLRAIMERLGLPNTLLGIDVVQKGRLLASDVNETQLLVLVEGCQVKIIVTPIGGQGYIFGRGNQQLSPVVIRKVGVENIIVVATKNKLASLNRKPLLVDTGDEKVDDMLRGYIQVITGRCEMMMYRVQ